MKRFVSVLGGAPIVAASALTVSLLSPTPATCQVNIAPHAQVSQTIVPDIPPLPQRTWTVTLTAANGGVFPAVIVAEPKQRITIRLNNQSTAPTNLVLRMPNRDLKFDSDVAPGATKQMTIDVPDGAGVFQFGTTADNSSSRGLKGSLIVNPLASGSPTAFAGARDIRLVARDFSFNPASPMLIPGEHVRLTLFNAGDVAHNMAIAFPTGVVTFTSALEPGEMRTADFVVPPQPGSYLMYDPVQGNRDKGSVGNMIVMSTPLVGGQAVAQQPNPAGGNVTPSSNAMVRAPGIAVQPSGNQTGLAHRSSHHRVARSHHRTTASHRHRTHRMHHARRTHHAKRHGS